VSITDDELVLAHFIVSADVERSRRFYSEVLGGRVAFSGPGGLTYVALSNSWIIINVGGGPTDDKPAVTLETPPEPDRVSSFLNIRVKDIEAVYAEWSARGAQFLTPPKQHQYDIAGCIRPLRSPHAGADPVPGRACRRHPQRSHDLQFCQRRPRAASVHLRRKRPHPAAKRAAREL
jgi:predicted enzyme related to lactoylglutathione lyase